MTVYATITTENATEKKTWDCQANTLNEFKAIGFDEMPDATRITLTLMNDTKEMVLVGG